jgi:hypothetical protein
MTRTVVNYDGRVDIYLQINDLSTQQLLQSGRPPALFRIDPCPARLYSSLTMKVLRTAVTMTTTTANQAGW